MQRQDVGHAFKEFPWWFSGSDFTLPLQGAWAPALVGELRFHMPLGWPKKEKVQIVTFHRLGTVDWLLGPSALPCPLHPRQRGSVHSEPDAEM